MRHSLHEIAKFASGLILADFIVGWWLSASNMLPVTFLGTTYTQDMILPWMVFDAALFIILVHYAWHLGGSPVVREKTYLLFVGIVFGLIAVVHFYRIFVGGDFSILGWETPTWLSWIGTAVAAYLSYMSFHLALTRRR
jgi:hypothetical protein